MHVLKKYVMIINILFLAFILGSCAAPQIEPSAGILHYKEQTVNEPLRNELLAMAISDQKIRRKIISSGIDSISDELLLEARNIDSRNTQRLKQIIEEFGWPNCDVVGKEGVSAALLIVQHSDRDINFQKRMLPKIKNAFNSGDISGQDLALLVDRVLIAADEMQIYGSQIEIVNGDVIVLPVSEPEDLDIRRKKLGLSTMIQYIKLIRQVYNLDESQ